MSVTGGTDAVLAISTNVTDPFFPGASKYRSMGFLKLIVNVKTTFVGR